MPASFQTLDSRTLARLRALVQTLHRRNGPALPMGELVRLARDVQLDAGVTVDFLASRELGQPMIVLRSNAPVAAGPCLAGLSPRERQVAALLADGLSNKQIARRLFISLATVKDHVHRILVKTGLSNRAAVAAAHTRGAPASPVESRPPDPDAAAT